VVDMARMESTKGKEAETKMSGARPACVGVNGVWMEEDFLLFPGKVHFRPSAACWL
jgi:hypothetical protein